MKFWIYIVILSIGIRLLFCLVLFPKFLVSYATVGSQVLFDDYFQIAKQITQGLGFSLVDGTLVIHRPPLYSLLLTVPILLSSTETATITAIQFMHSVMGGATVLMALLTTQLVTDRRSNAPIIAGLIVGLWPYSIWITKSTVPENLLALLLLGQTYLGLRYIKENNLRYLGLFGITSALLYLTHAAYISVAIGAILIVLVIGNTEKLLIKTLLVLSCFVSVIAPWNLRNSHIGFISASSATGFGLHYFKGWYYFEKMTSGEQYFKNLEEESAAYSNNILTLHGIPTVTSSSLRSNSLIMHRVDLLALSHLKDNFWGNIIKTLFKIPAMWIRQQSPLRALVNFILLCPLLYFAVIGAKFLSNNYIQILIIPALVLSISLSLIFVEDAPMRYALPMFPLLAIIASVGISTRLLNTKKLLTGSQRLYRGFH